jgi:dihydroorotate dehydrogenase
MWRISEACYALTRPILFRIEPERAHRMTIAMLARIPAGAPSPDPDPLRTMVFGLSFANPVGLAAGVDKDARAVRAWDSIGFGFAEIGTVTPWPQLGNPAPRMWRIVEHRGLINRLGFPSEGMEAVAPRLAAMRERGLRMRVAVNLGPNHETPPERVSEDYAVLTRRLGPLADLMVINVSSPNTRGLREFQAPERIGEIVAAIRSAEREAEHRAPILIKLAPDLEPLMLREICAAAIELGLAGIVATNTTLMREEVGVRSALAGGLSGEPLRARAREVIARIYRQTHGRLPIIGVGGIANAEDAYRHIRAGASLVELYTGMVYRGPGVVRAIKKGLIRLMVHDGFHSIGEAVGSASDQEDR